MTFAQREAEGTEGEEDEGTSISTEFEIEREDREGEEPLTTIRATTVLESESISIGDITLNDLQLTLGGFYNSDGDYEVEFGAGWMVDLAGNVLDFSLLGSYTSDGYDFNFEADASWLLYDGGGTSLLAEGGFSCSAGFSEGGTFTHDFLVGNTPGTLEVTGSISGGAGNNTVYTFGANIKFNLW